MSKPVIHGFPESSYVRTTRMALEEKGVDYEVQPIEFGSAEHLEMHPFGKMPWMTHGDVTLYETSAITRYVDENFDGPALQPVDAVERARMSQWISAIIDYYYGPLIREYVIERAVVPRRGGVTDEARVAAALPVVRDRIDVVEKSLADVHFLAGAGFSLADCFLAPIFFYVGMMAEGPELFANKPKIADWKARIFEMDNFKSTMPPQPEAAE